MRTRLLTASAVLVGSALFNQAHASSDDSCYPEWKVVHEDLDACNNQAFLNPGNDSQVNLRLLLADKGLSPAQFASSDPGREENSERSEGYGQVPFSLYRFGFSGSASDLEASEQQAASLKTLFNPMLQKLGLQRDDEPAAGDAFLDGEGSRCRSNSDASAYAFISQLVSTTDLPDTERRALADARLQMLKACTWEASEPVPEPLQSSVGKDFAAYLKAAAQFYSGDYDQAVAGFQSLSASTQPWLKQTAQYMVARSMLNAAQDDVFDEYGVLHPDQVDKPYLQQVETAFQTYLGAYPDGDYAASATGLLRRVHWLAGNTEGLAREYDRQLGALPGGPSDLNRLINEMDRSVLGSDRQALQTPWMLAIRDLMWMRESAQPRMSEADLQAQQALFAAQPGLYAYLQGVHAFYVADDPARALAVLPAALPEKLDYLSFSQQFLRGLALQARQDFKGAQDHWLRLIPLAQQPLQREQIELALAMSFERDEQLSRVFASDSPIQSRKVRLILLSHAADAELLRQQVTQGLDEAERDTALFVLLYKDLMRGRYQDFAEDFKRLPNPLPAQPLGYNLGYVYDKGPALSLFQWSGEQPAAGYRCPSIVQTAAALQADAGDPHSLNCLGEFARINRLDSMPLDARRDADSLGGTAPGFAGESFSRLEGYKRVIGNPKAGRDDKAYALFRAINCYGPAGYNTCGGTEVEPQVRKAWFRQLKKDFAGTQWGESQQYYW